MKYFSWWCIVLVGSLVSIDAVRAQTYGGRSENAAWREAAQQRIEEHRTSPINVAVRTADGQPMEGVEVAVTMTQPAFRFGTAVTTDRMSGTGTATYRKKVVNLTGDGRTFNLAVFGNAFKWGPWESGWPTSNRQTLDVVGALLSRDIDVRGHALLWSAEYAVPQDVRNSLSDTAFVSGRIEGHMQALAGHSDVQGHLIDWDVLNEPFHQTMLRDAFGYGDNYTAARELYARWFEWAAKADPSARLFVNEYNIIAHSDASSRQPYHDVIRGLLDADAPLGGIGMQGHFGTADVTDIDDVYTVLEEFAEYGLPISITEYDLAYYTNSSAGSGGACRRMDEQFAADYLRDFLTIVYSHPSVESFLIWGFWDGDHWRCDAPLFREDWSLKPSGQAYMDLVFGEWWTDEAGPTDASGVFATRGHLGAYTVTASVDGRVVAEQDVVLRQGAAADVTLQVTTTGSEESETPTGFEVRPPFPNPFGEHATLAYVLPQPSAVTLELYDVMGRLVQRREAGVRPAGAHRFEVDGSALPDGVYVYRVSTDEHAETGRLLIVR